MSYRNDLEAGGYQPEDDDDEASRSFYVFRSKNPISNARRRWRLVACVVYASRAFCYTLIGKERSRVRSPSLAANSSRAQIIGAAPPFQDSMRGVNVPGTTDFPAKPVHAGEFGYQPEDDDEASGPFNVVRTKNAPVEVLHRWRQAAWVLNAPRRFRYTRDLENDERRKRLTAIIRSHTQIIRAARFFQDSMRGVNGTTDIPSKPVHAGEFGISSEELESMSRELDCCLLQQNGGVEGVAEKLNSCLEKGLPEDDTDLINRRNKFGSNAYPPKKGSSLWRFLREAFQDFTLIILMVAAAAIIGLSIKAEGVKEGWYAGGSIVLAVLIVVIFQALSDYRQSLQFYNLEEEKRHVRTKVIRGGRRIEISIFEIVVGDVVSLEIGDQVPADGLLVSGYSLSIDESCLTGESVLVNKNSRAPFLMSGCEVADGYGTMLVTNVGLNTEWGLLMASISEDNSEETPLQIRLARVATYTGKVGLAVGATVLLVLIIRFFNGYTKDPNGTIQFRAGTTTVSDAIDGFIKLFTVAVTIVIVAVPEGLPLAVTLMLAYSMRKMMADKALFRRLSACETMGSATTICVDKTGTLTLNQMTVVEAYVCGKKIEFPYKNSELPPAVVSLLIEGIANNTTGSVFVPEGDGALEISGSPTEKAVLQWGVNLGMDFGAARSNSTIICAFPFNSQKKRSGVAVKLPNTEIHMHWKGAAETILASCTSYVDADDTVIQMDEDKLLHFGNAIEDMSARSLRCVAIAYRLYEMNNIPTITEELERWQLPEDDLVLLAVVGIKDPCRPGARDAVTLCTNAGVKVRMVTGDNLQTARAIALECGILGPNADATDFSLIEGRTFRCLSETKRLQVADKISVMAKSSPNDKLLLVQALRRRGHVVAVTGAGVNDAPALHEADIGLAMGIQGTEVAKKSADVIVMDDNFASVVKVVRWGRSVYANIQKFIQFQLTVTVTALIINFVAAVASGYVPLNVVQLLWISLIMDSLGALALAREPPTDHLMHRPPVGRREPLITNIMWRNIIVQAIYQVTVLLVINFQGRRILNLEHDSSDHAFKVKNTLVFNAFVFCQIFNMFNARKPDEFNVWRGVTRNHLFFGIVGFTVTLQFMIIHFLGKFTSTVRLTWKLWLFSIVIGIISWPLAAVGKFILVPAKPFSKFFTKKTDQQRNDGDTSLPQQNAGSALEAGRTFDWESGAEISLEAAKAVALRSPSIGKLTDEDIKASSIFLTEDINAYISDFGFYRLGFPAIPSRNAVYLDPELVGEKFTEKSGIYSFCVFLLGFLSKAPVLTRANTEADLPISIRSNEEEALTAEVLEGDLVNDANASACNSEGVEDDTCNV